jgi:hypothetical protein
MLTVADYYGDPPIDDSEFLKHAGAFSRNISWHITC